MPTTHCWQSCKRPQCDARLTDRQAIKIALLLALNTEESSIDAYTLGYLDENTGEFVRDAVAPRDRELVEQFRRNIAAFTRILDRYYGGRPKPLAFLKKIPGRPRGDQTVD